MEDVASNHRCDISHQWKPLLISLCTDGIVHRCCIRCRAEPPLEHDLIRKPPIMHTYGDPDTIIYPMHEE